VELQWDFDYNGSTFDTEAYGWAAEHTFDVGTYDIALKCMDDFGETSLSEPIHATFVDPSGNNPPAIDSIVKSRTTTKVGAYEERVTLTVTAHDPDVGDSISYLWSAPSGSFNFDNKASVEWTAPATAGHVYITVKVTDNHGAFDEDSDTMIRVTQFPTGAYPSGFNLSKPAPGWTLPRFPDHQSVSLSSVSPGNVVYLVFWMTTCSVCRGEMPLLADVYDDYTGQDLVFYLIGMDPSWDTVLTFYNNNPSWKATEWLHDPYPPSSAYVPILNLIGGTAGVPNHFIIDRDGNVRASKKGGIYTKTELTTVFNELL